MTESGTTAIQVSPTQDEESEMKVIAGFLEKASKVVVEASGMAPLVRQLRADLEALKIEVENVRETNRFLDESLTRVRRERDDAIGEARGLASSNADLLSQMSYANERISFLEGDLKISQELRVTASRERDDAQLRVMELEEQVKTLEAKLESVRGVLGWPKTEVPKVAPTIEETVAYTYPSDEGPKEAPKPADVVDLPGWTPPKAGNW